MSYNRILGDLNSPVVVINPYADYSTAGKIGEFMGKAGFLFSGCRFVELMPYAAEAFQDSAISARKTCPAPSWVHRKGLWFHPQLAAAFTALDAHLKDYPASLVIGLGPEPLAWYTGETKLAAWRASRLSLNDYPFTFFPCLHPRILVKQSDQEWILKFDLKRAYGIFIQKQLPRKYNFLIKPSFEQVINCLLGLLAKADAARSDTPLKLSGDTETRAGTIACMGIAWSETDAICIPHLVIDPDQPFYWSVDEEGMIIQFYKQLFTHPNIKWVGQNFIYDCQYFLRFWFCAPTNVYDTMIGHHALFSNTRKSLAFLSSIYAQDHVYWKDDINDWDPKQGELQYWTYNCKDAVITYECADRIAEETFEDGRTPHADFQQSLFNPVLRIMQRGIRVDKTLRDKYAAELSTALFHKEEQLNYIVGHELNAASPVQLKKFFYEDLKLKGVQALGKEALTTNSPALAMIAQREPWLQPLCLLIVEIRSIKVFLSTFIGAKDSSDGRMRCSYIIPGTETNRFASREDAFGSGMNLQNVPVGEKIKIKDPNYIKLPNVRKLFIPDPGKEFFDMDLDRADLQVVTWEADDTNMKQALRMGLDLHCVNACDIFNIKGIPYDELNEKHPNYKEHRGRIGEANRGKAKAGVHATNYGVGDGKLAQSLGISISEAGVFRGRWFGVHPGIRRWHLRTETNATRYGFIENKFGARLYLFGRFNLPEFLGWLPQSTVAGVINRALVNIDKAHELGDCPAELLGQVHDSLFGQYPIATKVSTLKTLRDLSEIIIPYDDPLIIPVGFKTSIESWGDCK
jgi:DNA polymerase I-like protein with 3'-5' exonuclease and polymerase domains